MNLVIKTIRYYLIACFADFLIIWVGQKFVFDKIVVLGIVFVLLFYAPLKTLFIVLLHILKINKKILGNIYYVIMTSLFPTLLIGLYSFVANQLTDNHFILSQDGKILSRKFYLDDSNIYIIVYCIFFIILFLHGKTNDESKQKNGVENSGTDF